MPSDDESDPGEHLAKALAELLEEALSSTPCMAPGPHLRHQVRLQRDCEACRKERARVLFKRAYEAGRVSAMH